MPTFAYQAQTLTYTAAFPSAPADRRVYSIDRAVRRLKAKPSLFAKIKGGWLTIGDAKLINIVNPAMISTPGSTPVADVPNVGISGDNTIATASIRTGFIPSARLSQNNNHFGVFVQETITQANGGAVGGAISAGSGRFLISPKDSGISGGASGGCCSSATITLMSSASNDGGRGFFLLSRDNSATIAVYRNQRLVNAALASPSGALPTTDISINGFNNSGTVGNGTWATIGYVTIGDALTQAEALDYYAIIRTLLDEIRSGEPTFVEPGFAVPNTYWDAVVLSTTPNAIGAAVELKRQGKNVLLLGTMFERHLGGVMSGGLGKTDLLTSSAVAGVWSAIKYRANQYAGGAVNDYAEPRFFEWAFRGILDPTRGGFDVPVYWSTGFASIVKNGPRDWTITTRDGKKVRTKVFHDGTYEGDGVALTPGITYTIGREAAGSGAEALNGVDLDQLTNGIGAAITVSPLVIPGDATSGFLAPIIDGTGLVAGTGDIATYRNGSVIASSGRSPRTQAYNYRLSVTTTDHNAYVIAMPTGYNEADYELLLRLLAAATASGNGLTFTDGLTTVVPVGSVSDLNNGGAVSTDYIGYSHNYIEAGYEVRNSIRKATQNHVKGFMYTMQNSLDTRITAGNKAIAGEYRLAGTHYTDPIPEDAGDYFFPYALYVREGRHVVGSLKWDANDIAAVDGTVPRSVKTVACASYGMDSHGIDRIALQSGGVWKTWGDGGLYAEAGGVDKISPLPMEIFMPIKAECEDMTTAFAGSMTHIAFASARMEPTMIAIGQGMGAVLAEALTAGVAVQDVSYANVRARLLASASLPGETAPYLPQIN